MMEEATIEALPASPSAKIKEAITTEALLYIHRAHNSYADHIYLSANWFPPRGLARNSGKLLSLIPEQLGDLNLLPDYLF